MKELPQFCFICKLPLLTSLQGTHLNALPMPVLLWFATDFERRSLAVVFSQLPP